MPPPFTQGRQKSAFVNLPLSVSAADEGLQGGQSNIVNGSFKYPYLCEDDRANKNTGWTNVAYDNKSYDSEQLGWKTTATDKNIEYAWLKNTDVPAQYNENGESIPPRKTSKDARDQLMQISDWLYSQTEMPLDLPTDGGCSDKIKVYTPKFNSTGGWDIESKTIFSFYKDSVHTEEWSVWVISSKNDKWYDYGELDSSATYSYECVIPEGQENTIFGFVSHSSLKADGQKTVCLTVICLIILPLKSIITQRLKWQWMPMSWIRC